MVSSAPVMKWPLGLALVLGAVLAQVFLVGDSQFPGQKQSASSSVPPSEECAPARPGRLQGEKEFLVGQQPKLKSGSLTSILERADNNSVIITFASSKRKAFLVNWLARIHELGIVNYAIVCQDEELMTWLTERKSRCQYVLTDWSTNSAWEQVPETTCEGKTTDGATIGACKMACEADPECRGIAFKRAPVQCLICPQAYTASGSSGTDLHLKATTEKLAYQRWKLLVRLLNSGVSVLVSDLDGAFLQNPMPYVHAVSGDILVQRAGQPERQAKKWGAAVSTGFSFWRPTVDTKRLLVQVTNYIETAGDEEVALNIALDKMNVRWDTPTLQFERARSVNYGVNKLGLQVSLLPHDKFPRKCDAWSEDEILSSGLVPRCFSPEQTQGAAMLLAQKYKLWLIRDDWQTAVDPSSAQTFEEYLKMLHKPVLSETGRGSD